MKTIQTEKMDNAIFSLVLDNDKRLVSYQGKKYQVLTDLVHEVPALSSVNNVLLFSKIANFLFQGTEFSVIENGSLYQEIYKNKNRPVEYGHYDVSTVDSPKIVDGKVKFYVENTATGVPYCVTCPFPFNSTSHEYHYKLLDRR